MSNLFERKWLIYLIGVCFFFALVHYLGFYEDAGRYLLQVINFLHPERFTDDVPFMYGNQDSFTIFSPIISIFYKLLGVNKGAILATLTIQLLWCIFAIRLMISWASHANCLKYALPIFIICIATINNRMYGSGNYFPILENILVARFLAITLVLGGFSQFFNKNKFYSLSYFLVAFVIHPLTGGWGLPLWIFFHYPKFKYPILLAAILFPLTAFFHVGLLDFYSADWSYATNCFTPQNKDFVTYALILTFWIFMFKLLEKKSFSNFCLNMFWICLVGFYFQLMGAYTGHMLLYQAQPYRVQLFCAIPMFPIFAIFAHDFFSKSDLFSLIFLSNKRIIKTFLVGSFIILICHTAFTTFSQIYFDSSWGNANTAKTLISVSSKIHFFPQAITFLLTLLFFISKKSHYFFIFLFSFLNPSITILPLVGIFLFLSPSLRENIKNVIIAFTSAYTFFEILTSTASNSVQESTIAFPLLLAVIFITLLTFLTKKAILPLIFLILAISVWDIYKWDARGKERQEAEAQMDTFFDQPIFPQIQNRGRILFVVDNEAPLESRFVFLSGTYADKTINIGEIFYKGQHFASIRRKGALFARDTNSINSKQILDGMHYVYNDPDTLSTRTTYLCNLNEISHLVTDFNHLALTKEDSIYLEQKKTFVYLYGCN